MKDERSFPVTIQVDVANPQAALKPVWRFFGYDEPNYTYMKDGKKLLSQLSALSPETVYIRAHNLLTTGDGTPALKWGSTNAYTEDADGVPHYDWTLIDRIFDTYRERNLRPLVQIGFMPEALSSKPQPYQHAWVPGSKNPLHTGWAYPPNNYQKWAELVFQWVKHSIERYGQAEVEGWYWEVWNEPNIFYWQGTPEEYHQTYDYAVDAVKRALPTARVGGPHVAGTRHAHATQFLRDFLDHCLRGVNYATGAVGSPIDFVAFHAKGEPKFIAGHVETGIAAQLQDINSGFSIVASYPELANKPIIIGESDPDGCAACPEPVYPQNGYRNGTLFASYTAAVFARKHLLADRHKINFEGAVTWAFEFEDQPYFAGFRVLASNGIALPVLNVFRMFGQMRGQRLSITSSADLGLDAIMQYGVRDQADVAALACTYDKGVSVLVWHHHDIDIVGPDAAVTLTLQQLSNAQQPMQVLHYRIDDTHSNAFTAWKRMGSPQQPSPAQYAQLEQASELSQLQSPSWATPNADGNLTLTFNLPRQAVSLLVVR